MKYPFLLVLVLTSLQAYCQFFILPIYSFVIADVTNEEELFASYLKVDSIFVTKDLNKAYQEVNGLISQDKTNPRWYMQRAFIKRKSEQAASALADFEKAAELAKQQGWSKSFFDSLYLEKCITRVRVGQRAVSPCFDQYLAKYPKDKRALFYKALNYYCFNIEGKTERFPHAISAFEEVLKVDSGNLDAMLFIGTSYYRIKIYEEATQMCTKAIEQNAQFGPAYLIRGKSYVRSKEFENACADFKTAQTLGVEEAKGLAKKHCK